MSVASGVLFLIAQVCVTQQVQLTGSDSTHFDRFGCDVDVQGDRIVVGAEYNRPITIGTQTGSAYVFELVSGAWQEMAQLTPSVPVPKGQFGHAVALDGSTIAVGAPAVPQSVAGGKGVVYVFIKNGAIWQQQALIDPADALAVGFGWDLALDADTLLIGAKDAGTGNTGLAYVYSRSGTAWTQQAKLGASDATHDNSFGYSVALKGDTAIVCAGRADGAQTNTGAAYVFGRSGTAWSETQKIFAADGKASDWFGLAVDYDGTTVAIGAVYCDTGAVGEHGAVYTFTKSGAQWVEQQKIRPKGYGQNEIAGCSVAVDGNELAFGAPNEPQTPGFVHLATRSGSTWLQHLKVSSNDNWCVPGNPCIPAQLGSSLALQGSRFVAGAPGAEVAGLQQLGAAYVFDVQMQGAQPTYFCTVKTDSKGCMPRFFHAGVPSVSGALAGELYQVKGLDVRPKVPGMLFYSTSGAANAPFAGGTMCIQQPQHATQFAVTATNGLTPPCNGQFSFDFNAWIASGVDPNLNAGQTVWMQYWYRDPGGVPGVNIGLTDGIFVSICP